MSSVPPTPPGGGQPPYPPYDPKAQWQAWRTQQKYNAKAQRDAQKVAWKAQKAAWKAQSEAQYGPHCSSIAAPMMLIAVGVVALLAVLGRMDMMNFWSWYAQWWPWTLIAAGVVLLAEWAIDARRATLVRRRSGIFWICALLLIAGLCASGWKQFGNYGPWNWGDSNNDIFSFNAMGLPEHDREMQLNTPAGQANITVNIDSPRGDVSVSTSNDLTVSAQVHAVAYARTDQAADRVFTALNPQIRQSGNVVQISANDVQNSRVNLDIVVPASAHVSIHAEHGDITAAGISGGIYVNAPHGDVHLNSITGGVQARLSKGEFQAHDVTGDINGDGTCNDLSLSEIHGRLNLNCDYFDQMHFEQIYGAVHFRTSKTDVSLDLLTGTLDLSDEELNITGVHGNARISTHSRDVSLEQIWGPSSVENRDGKISIEMAGNYPVEARNAKGDVELTVPTNVGAELKVQTRNGDIESEYPAPSFDGPGSKTASFRIGDGGNKINLSAENGDISIKKGAPVSAKPAPPAPAGKPAKATPPAPAAAPAAPKPPNAPHFKSTKGAASLQQ